MLNFVLKKNYDPKNLKTCFWAKNAVKMAKPKSFGQFFGW